MIGRSTTSKQAIANREFKRMARSVNILENGRRLSFLGLAWLPSSLNHVMFRLKSTKRSWCKSVYTWCADEMYQEMSEDE